MKNRLVDFIVVLAILLVILMVLFGCTSNTRARIYGGTSTVNVKSGYKVTVATWKGSDLWYFIEPMEDDYQPKVKELIEDSRLGIIEGKVRFVESR